MDDGYDIFGRPLGGNPARMNTFLRLDEPKTPKQLEQESGCPNGKGHIGALRDEGKVKSAGYGKGYVIDREWFEQQPADARRQFLASCGLEGELALTDSDTLSTNTQYWCVNFDSEECLKHGLRHSLWLMQYQYEDELGNVFQGGNQKSATTTNWKRLTQIQDGDWFVAYLPKSRSTTGRTFFAIGEVRTPRKSASSDDHFSTVSEYVVAQRSHEYKHGVVHYQDAPVFYEDFDDEWQSGNPLMRYAQRIDVERWQHYVAKGVAWLDELLEVPLNQRRRAFFKIKKESFDKIVEQLTSSNGDPTSRTKGRPEEIVDEPVVVALETSQAKSQGFMLDSELRKKLEDYSMATATEHFESLGFAVQDRSKNHPYDLKCVREDETLYVEVKGTQTDGSGVILTTGEVEFARQHSEHMALFVLHSIQVSKDRKDLSNGDVAIIHPWVIEQAALNPLSYKYTVPSE